MSVIDNKPNKTSDKASFTSLRQASYSKLFIKYSTDDFSFEKISINNLVFNETCLVVARFKDFLIYDDNSEFLRRFYDSGESNQRLNKILTFYETYSKIFPNYLVLEENKYLYRNIRKKQKMIDAINEIKREEKENKKKLSGGKKKSDNNELFTKKIKDEIKTFQKNISSKKYNNSFDSEKNADNTLLINQNSISISILNWKQYEKNENLDEKINKSYNWGTNIDSFITNQTNGSLSEMVNVLTDNKLYIKDLQNIFSKSNINPKQKQQKNNNNKTNKKINDIGKKNKISKIAKTNSKAITNNKKKINDKNNVIKYAKTSNNATNSSSIVSKRIKNQMTSSSACKNDKKNKENEKNMYNTNMKDQKMNIYQNTSPKVQQLKLKKNFLKTNTNFNKIKASLSKNKQKNNIKTEENLLLKKNENISKKYLKCKHISQDFDSKIISKVTNNILNNNNKSTKNKETNFYTENNPNLITGDTKTNEKMNIDEKVHVNVRDIIKEREKEKEKEREKNNEKYIDIKYNTDEKKKNDDKAKLVLKMTKMRTNNFMTSRGLKMINENSANKRNKSLSIKQKTEKIMKQKKLFSNQQKSITRGTFIKNKYLENKKNLREEKIIQKEKLKEKSKEKEIQKSNEKKNEKEIQKDNEKQNENKNINENNNLNENENPKDQENKENNIINIETNKETNNIIISEKKDENHNNEEDKKNEIEQYVNVYETKIESNQLTQVNDNRNISEREMSSNMSDSHMNKLINQKTLSNDKSQQKYKNSVIRKSKNDGTLNNLNSSAKFNTNGIKQKFKTFLVKKKTHHKVRIKHNNISQKNLLSINILKRIQEVKRNKTKSNFYKISQIQNSSEANNNNINLTKSTQFKNNKINLVKTPLTKTNKIEFFKKNITSKKINPYRGTSKKEETTKNYISSFSIKVNKNIYNKDNKGKKDKNKNLKKSLTKNMNNVVGKKDNIFKKENKK